MDILADRAGQLESGPLRVGGSRLVLHHQISEEAVNDLLSLLASLKKEHGAKGVLNGHEDWNAESEAFANGKGLDWVPPVQRKTVKSSYGR